MKNICLLVNNFKCNVLRFSYNENLSMSPVFAVFQTEETVSIGLKNEVIQFGGIKLSTQISLVLFFIQKSYPKKTYPKTYVTYLT